MISAISVKSPSGHLVSAARTTPGPDTPTSVSYTHLQYDSDGEGHYELLSPPNIDTGMGLERLACVMQNVGNLFEVDTVQNIMKQISSIAGAHYGESAKEDISLRVITDQMCIRDRYSTLRRQN